MSKLKTAGGIIWTIVKAFWKLFLLGVYSVAKMAEGFAKLIAKITEKYIE